MYIYILREREIDRKKLTNGTDCKTNSHWERIPKIPPARGSKRLDFSDDLASPGKVRGRGGKGGKRRRRR